MPGCNSISKEFDKCGERKVGTHFFGFLVYFEQWISDPGAKLAWKAFVGTEKSLKPSGFFAVPYFYCGDLYYIIVKYVESCCFGVEYYNLAVGIAIFHESFQSQWFVER